MAGGARRRAGRVVLTTVNHLNRDVVELTLADADGVEETVRPTGLHKFYSVDRQAWVSCEDLWQGETIQGLARRYRRPGLRTFRDCRSEDEAMSNDFREPWVEVGQFADNLVKELQREVVSGHPLWGKEACAVPQRTDSDDVLFKIEGVEPSYAVVHLTWSGEPELDPHYPDVRLFASLDQWMREGMMQDHEEFMR